MTLRTNVVWQKHDLGGRGLKTVCSAWRLLRTTLKLGYRDKVLKKFFFLFILWFLVFLFSLCFQLNCSVFACSSFQLKAINSTNGTKSCLQNERLTSKLKHLCWQAKSIKVRTFRRAIVPNDTCFDRQSIFKCVVNTWKTKMFMNFEFATQTRRNFIRRTQIWTKTFAYFFISNLFACNMTMSNMIFFCLNTELPLLLGKQFIPEPWTSIALNCGSQTYWAFWCPK